MSKAYDYLGNFDEIFVCYVSETSVDINKKITRQFIISKLDDNYKIIAIRYPKAPSSPTSYETIPWGNFTAHADGFEIDDYGKLEEIKDFMEPEGNIP